MNKLVNTNNDEKKIITFTVNKEIKERLEAVLNSTEGYNKKKKSQWVNEAIAILKENPDYKHMVCNAEGNNEDFVFDKIYMTFEQRCFFAEMRNEVVKEYPDLKGPQAAIIRAAILSRLLRKA